MSDLPTIEVHVYRVTDANYCYECDGEPEWPDKEDNDIFLCGPEHSPLNADCNYYCRAHLDSCAIIHEDPLEDVGA